MMSIIYTRGTNSTNGSVEKCRGVSREGVQHGGRRESGVERIRHSSSSSCCCCCCNHTVRHWITISRWLHLFHQHQL
ncbi:unnamed protein product [Rodentolepis nana]|uniref:Uncharacterized protein n=1 Tax=Rodentolepis nana TaxID=102285 RepID=A0A3P7SSR5_RODNA|nr:unnamed protein product [Rodentolepis nana]